MPRLLVIILLLALALRVGVGAAHPFLFDDSADYLALGQAMATGHDYCTPGGQYASRMPGYPVLIAGVDLVFGTEAGGMRALLVVQALMGAGTCYLVYRLGRGVSERVGLVAAGLAAVDPLSVAFSGAVLSETAFTFLMVLALVMVRARGTGRVGRWIWLAVVLAGAVYLRASFLPLGVLVLFWRWRDREHVGHGPANCAGPWHPILACVVLMGLLSPWFIRNYIRPETRGVVFTSIEGISLYEVVYGEADGGPRQDKIEVPVEMRGLTEAQRNREWSRRAWGEVWAHPGRVLALAPVKVARTWSPWLNAEGYRIPAVQVLLSLWHIPLYVLALLSVIVAGWREKLNVAVVGPVVYFTVLHAFYMGSVRYRVPVMPLVDVAAAVALVGLLRKGAQREAGERV